MVAAILAGGAGPATRSPLATAHAQDDLSGRGRQLYDQIKAFKLTGGSADVTNLALKRDRVEMTFTGTFYFAGAIDGAVTGAVFSGQGTLHAVPPNDIERDNVRRLIAADVMDSDFKTAVLRFSDDTFGLIAANRKDGTAPAAVQKIANDADAAFLLEIGANIASRLAVSILNQDKPGVFVAQYDGGRRGRFSYAFDPQARIPVANFNLNAGEKGVIYQYQNAISFPEVWMAFASLDDTSKNAVVYSDAYDVVDVSNYRLGLDLRDYGVVLGGLIEMTVRGSHVRALSFNIGESLSASQKSRLDNQLRVKRIRLGDKELAWTQEDWEGGFTVYLPQAMDAGATLPLNVDLAGAFLRKVSSPDCYYPISNTDWLPRHGYLDRATFDLTFRHRKTDRVASIGKRVTEEVDPSDQSSMITRYRMDQPVALAVFALGPWVRKSKQITFEGGGPTIQIEFNSLQALSVRDDFFLNELDNAVRYFAAMFGAYPYPVFGAAIHPFGFGQGFPTLLMIPPVQRTGVTVRDSDIYSFIAHEASHQWWGNIVAWRSYRDQWLSEGFAEYSGLLYAARRGSDPMKTTMELLRDMRESLRNPPQTVTGVGKGRLNDIGPIVQGLHLNSTKTLGAYQALIYSKGALVLRMLHFLLSNPTNGSDAEFLATMKDFVDQHRNGSASTEDFWRVASIHFARTPIAGKFGLNNLDWFFKQWVYGTGLPSYSLDYETKTQPDGTLMLTGTVKQDGVDPDWQMVLPLVMTFDGNQEARTSVRVSGASTPFEIKVPIKPKKVELDPFNWVLSEKTVSRGK
jgi:hypothetical protein